MQRTIVSDLTNTWQVKGLIAHLKKPLKQLFIYITGMKLKNTVYMEASAVLNALFGRNYLEVVISEITKAIW